MELESAHSIEYLVCFHMKIRFLIIVIAIAVSTSIDVNQVYGPTPFGYDGNYPRNTTGDYDHCFDYVTDPEYGVVTQNSTHRLDIEDCEWKMYLDGPIIADNYPPGSPIPEQDIPINENCEPGTTYQDGICLVSSEQEPDEIFGTWEATYDKWPPVDLSASCALDGVLAMWVYQYIVNPLCGMGIQIIPDYECNCNI